MTDITVDDACPAMSLGNILAGIAVIGIAAISLVARGSLVTGGAGLPGLVPNYAVHYHLPANLPVPGSSIKIVATVSGTNIFPIFQSPDRRDRR